MVLSTRKHASIYTTTTWNRIEKNIMSNARYRIEFPKNEPINNYAPGTPERARLKQALAALGQTEVDIPLIINGKAVETGNTRECVMPHDHGHVLGRSQLAGRDEVQAAIDAAQAAYPAWSRMDWADRLAIFLKAADLLAGPWRDRVNASTMLGVSKNAFQAEIDVACELADFLRFNAYFATELYAQQPVSSPEMWNRVEYRPLEGFVFAVTPFNFTSIAGNLPTAPAMMGNVVLWKPASSAIYPAWFVMQILLEAGLPPGVINFIPGKGSEVGDMVMTNENLAGVHFTGSTRTFQHLWKQVGENLENYRTYPRIVGETGGKDFIVAHPSADPKGLQTALIRGAFEYQGQKCSAASRAYLPASLWEQIRDPLVEEVASLKMGEPTDFRNFVNAVIDQASFDTIKGYVEDAAASDEAEILVGGGCDDSKGYFVEPTVILAANPRFRTMEEEIFGPVLTIYVYEDEDYSKVLDLCDATSPYALTGAIFSRDKAPVLEAMDRLQHAAGNFYINDKPTGAVVGQQPFGGSRASGTNDKAGSALNMIRWVSPRTLKETFITPTEIGYPFMGEA
jgi:1-pyrroline-5-carboxylate dehydrogenase